MEKFNQLEPHDFEAYDYYNFICVKCGHVLYDNITFTTNDPEEHTVHKFIDGVEVATEVTPHRFENGFCIDCGQEEDRRETFIMPALDPPRDYRGNVNLWSWPFIMYLEGDGTKPDSYMDLQGVGIALRGERRVSDKLLTKITNKGLSIQLYGRNDHAVHRSEYNSLTVLIPMHEGAWNYIDWTTADFVKASTQEFSEYFGNPSYNGPDGSYYERGKPCTIDLITKDGVDYIRLKTKTKVGYTTSWPLECVYLDMNIELGDITVNKMPASLLPSTY